MQKKIYFYQFWIKYELPTPKLGKRPMSKELKLLFSVQDLLLYS